MVLIELVFALKRLRARSASIGGVIAMLIVGISLATTMFGLSDPFLFRPLPYARADRLVSIDIDTMQFALAAGVRQTDYPLLRDWQARRDLFDCLGGFVPHDTLRVRLSDRTIALETVAVSEGFFEVLGLPADPPRTPAALDEVWLTSRSATGPLRGLNLVGQRLPLQPSGMLRVSGVLPPSFIVPQARALAAVDALVEWPAEQVAVTESGMTKALHLIGRLRDGLSPQQVEAALNADAMPRGFGVRVVPLELALKARQRPLAIGALLAGLLVLIASAANTLGMALTRGLYRAHEIAAMEVLGAGRSRIARLLLAEAIWVAAGATVGALLVVPLLFDAIVVLVPRELALLGAPGFSGRAAAFAGAAGLIACLAWWIGSLVAWCLALPSSLRRTAVQDARTVRAIRFGLTAGQVAVALVLLTTAGLLIQTYVNLVRQDTGMSDEAMALSVSYEPELNAAALQARIRRTTEGLQRLPGVRRAAAVVGEMVDQSNITGMVVIGSVAPVELLWVSPGYFETTGMTFVAGRALLESDTGGQGVVVNEAFVERHLHGNGAIGVPLKIAGRSSPVVGVVKNSRRRALDQRPRPAVFRLLEGAVPNVRVTYVTTGTGVGPELCESIIHRISPEAVILDGSTLRERLARTIQIRSFATLITILFALATTTVAGEGVIGVVSYVAARRTREMGIRLALGATSAGVTWLTMRDACASIAGGAIAGLIGVIWLSDVASSLLYGVSPRDWATLVGTTFALVGLATAAALVPARRAGLLSPTAALREE